MNKLPSLGMLYDHIRPEERLLIDAAKRKGIKLELYNAEEIFFEASEIDNAQNFQETVLQRCISYFRSINLSALLESRSINVINSSKIASLCGNKLLATSTLTKEKIPTPKTFIAFTIESALNALSKIGYPAVIKPIIGSWGRLVAPLKDPESARAILENRDCMFPVYQVYYLQEMIERPSRDMRCFIVGDKAVAAIYRYSGPDDWRTNAARGGRVENCKITAEIEDISIKAAKVFGDGIFGVDIMESPRGLLVHEVNYTTEFRNSVPATGVDIPGLILDYAVRRSKK